MSATAVVRAAALALPATSVFNVSKAVLLAIPVMFTTSSAFSTLLPFTLGNATLPSASTA